MTHTALLKRLPKCPFEIWECKNCGGIYRPPAVSECDCSPGDEPEFHKYIANAQAADIAELVACLKTYFSPNDEIVKKYGVEGNERHEKVRALLERIGHE